MNTKLLRDLLDVLKDIRAELQGNVDDSVLSQLDSVIRDLEAALESKSGRFVSALKILTLLGTLIEKIPEVAKVLDQLIRLLK